MENPALSFLSSVGFKAESTPGTKEALTTGGVFLDFTSHSLKYIAEKHKTPILTGERQQRASGSFVSHYNANGSVSFNARHNYMDEVLSWIFGYSNGGIYSPVGAGSPLELATIEINEANVDLFKLIGCGVNSASFRSTGQDPLTIELDIIGMSGERASDVAYTTPTPASISAWEATPPFLSTRCALASAASSFLDGMPIKDVEFTINNNIDGEGWAGSMDRVIMPHGECVLEGSFMVPYNANTKAAWTAAFNNTKVKFYLTYGDGTNTLIFNFVAHIETAPPDISEVSNLWVPFEFKGVIDDTDTNMITAEIS